MPGPGVLLVTMGSTAGSKNIGCKPRQRGVERLACRQRERRAVCRRSLGRCRKRLRRALEHELAGREVVVGTVVDPEQLGVALDLRERRRVDAFRDG